MAPPSPRLFAVSYQHVSELLRGAAARQAMPSGPLWDTLVLALGSEQAARAQIFSAVSQLAKEPSVGGDPNRAARLAAIVQFNYIEHRAAAEASRLLGIPRSRFYKERRVALARLATLIERGLAEATGLKASTLSLFDLEIAEADAAERAGVPRRAIAALRGILERGVDRSARIKILSRLVPLYARQGERRAAERALDEARRSLSGAFDAADRRLIELAETRLAANINDYSLLRALVDRLAVDGHADTPASIEHEVEALCELAMAQLDRSDLASARDTICRIDGRLAKHWQPPVELRVRALIVRAHLHLAVPETIGLGRSEARIAFQLAARHGLVREGWRALNVLVENHLGTLDLSSELTYGTHLLRAAQRIGEPDLILEASLTVASVDAQMNRLSDARRRIAAFSPPAHSRIAVERAMIEAFILMSDGDNSSAFEVAVNARRNAESIGLATWAGIALLLESILMAKLGSRRKVLPMAFAAAEALEVGTRPYNLADAYLWLYRVTGEQRFQRRRHAIASTFRDGMDVLRSYSTTSWQEGLSAADSTFGDRLTARQKEIAALVRAGKTNGDIGRELGISESTVAHHVEAILRRLGIRARWQMMETTEDLLQLQSSQPAGFEVLSV